MSVDCQERLNCARLKTFQQFDDNFCWRKVVQNQEQLLRHVLDVVMPLFSRFKLKDNFPMVLEYRASTLVNNMIIFELFCVLLPEQIHYDPLHLMQLFGNGLFTTIISPCGTARDEWKAIMLLHFYKYRKTSFHHHAKGVYMIYNRLMANLHKYTHGWWFNDKLS